MASTASPDYLARFYDIALRDFGLMLGALGLARLASAYDAPPRPRRPPSPGP
jgi:hypothetical protein